MIIPLVSLYKRFFIQEGLNEMVSQMTSEVVNEMIENYRKAHEELASQKLGVIDIESETWYAFNLATEDSWRIGLRRWGEILTREIPRRYLLAGGGGPGGKSTTPFTVSVSAGDRGFDIRFRRLRLGGGTLLFSKEAARNATVELARDTVKAYIRCVATRGIHFPEDY